MNEIWKPIEGYNGKYFISDKGNVLAKNWQRRKIDMLLCPTLSTTGYYKVDLYKDNKRKQWKIHRLVAIAFIPNTENKPCIDHINTIRTDNRAENLRWVTHSENLRNEITRKRMSDNAKKRTFSDETKKKLSLATKNRKDQSEILKRMHKASMIKICKPVRCIETGKIYKTAREASAETGINWKDISGVCTHRRKSCKKTHWEFV